MKMIKIFGLLFVLSQTIFCQDNNSDLPLTIKPSSVVIQVTNMDSSALWYQNILGFTLVDKIELTDNNLKIAMLKKDAFEIDLVENKNSISRELLLKNYPPKSEIRGFSILTFTTNTIDKADMHLRKNGVKYLFNLQLSNIPNKENQKWLMVSDPDGNWIKLVSE